MLDLSQAARRHLRPCIAVPHGAPDSSEELRVTRVAPVHLHEQLAVPPCRWSRRSRRRPIWRSVGSRVPTASPSSARLARTRRSGGNPACDPIDEEDRRGDEDTDRRARERPGKRALPSTRHERTDDDQPPSEAAHGRERSGLAAATTAVADRDAQRGKGRVARSEQIGIELGPLPLEDETSDDLADADHEPDSDSRVKPRGRRLRCERDDDEREHQDRRESRRRYARSVRASRRGLARSAAASASPLSSLFAIRLAISSPPAAEDEEHGIRRAAAAGLVSARGVDRPPCLDIGDREEASLVLASEGRASESIAMRVRCRPARHAHSPSKAAWCVSRAKPCASSTFVASPARAPSAMSMTALHRWQTRWAWPVLAQVVEGGAVRRRGRARRHRPRRDVGAPDTPSKGRPPASAGSTASIRSSAVRWASVSRSTLDDEPRRCGHAAAPLPDDVEDLLVSRGEGASRRHDGTLTEGLAGSGSSAGARRARIANHGAACCSAERGAADAPPTLHRPRSRPSRCRRTQARRP